MYSLDMDWAAGEASLCSPVISDHKMNSKFIMNIHYLCSHINKAEDNSMVLCRERLLFNLYHGGESGFLKSGTFQTLNRRKLQYYGSASAA